MGATRFCNSSWVCGAPCPEDPEEEDGGGAPCCSCASKTPRGTVAMIKARLSKYAKTFLSSPLNVGCISILHVGGPKGSALDLQALLAAESLLRLRSKSLRRSQ